MYIGQMDRLLYGSVHSIYQYLYWKVTHSVIFEQAVNMWTGIFATSRFGAEGVAEGGYYREAGSSYTWAQVPEGAKRPMCHLKVYASVVYRAHSPLT